MVKAWHACLRTTPMRSCWSAPRAPTRSLISRETDVTRILCGAIARLHVVKKPPPPDLIPLATWFADLWPFAARHGGLWTRAAEVAQELLGAPQDVVVLHGDIHHDNVLDFGARGWLAIDPKRVIGERGFDYANIFCNPDYATATASERFQCRLNVVVEESALERTRLLKWILAWTGLSAAWFMNDNLPADTDFGVAQLATAELRSGGCD